SLLFFLPIEPHEDYYNHINWAKGYYDQNLYPYRDFYTNEYPVLSVWGWILMYKLSPVSTYEITSIFMLLPYWILAFGGGIALYKILIQEGITEKSSILIVALYFFTPYNMVDTLANHGSLGTSATVILAIYFLRENKHTTSAFFAAVGISLKIYPIFVVPFLVVSINNKRERINYFLSGTIWTFIIHLRVIFILDSYFEVLTSKIERNSGITYSSYIYLIETFSGITGLSIFIWLFTLLFTIYYLLHQPKANLLEKFTIIMMVNNLFQTGRGSFGHINTVIPFLAIYYLIENKSKFRRIGFLAYIILGTLFHAKRIIPGYETFSTSSLYYFNGIFSFVMIVFTTVIFYLYLKWLHECGKLTPMTSFPLLLHKDRSRN
ncbi:MAG: hypothetical protein ACXAC2_12820, partial [Candidatus Kariarchaeaceae archaeon]